MNKQFSRVFFNPVRQHLTSSVMTRNKIACANFLTAVRTAEKTNKLSHNGMMIMSHQMKSYATDDSGVHQDFQPKFKKASSSPRDLHQEISDAVSNNPIVLYMKGTPEYPECGFSRAVVQILNVYGYKYKTFNMNADLELKEAVKEYSEWPTIPQLYVKGEFIGGCDIVRNLHNDGELEQILQESGASTKQ